MAKTNNLSLTLVETAQSQKEVTVNEALARIDALQNMSVIDRDLTTPPSSPHAGDTYIIGASATGDWSGKDGQIAYFDQIWRFIEPQKGLRVFVADEWMFYLYDGGSWRYEEGFQGNLAQQPASGTSYTLNYAAGSSHELTLDSSLVTLSITNAPFSFKTGRLFIILKQDATGGRAVTWPASVKWAGGTAPTLSSAADAVYIVQLTTVDGGTSWYGQTIGLDMQ